MKEIPLTRNMVAIVDDEDYEWLNQHKMYDFWARDLFGKFANTNFKSLEQVG